MQNEMNAVDLRQHLTDAFIEELRKRFPTDAEVDKVLTRKMVNRAKRTGVYTPVTLEEMVAGVSRLIKASTSGSFAVSNPRWLSGGASMLQL